MIGRWRRHDAALRRAFADSPERDAYEFAVRYLLTGFLDHASPRFASARYPGLRSGNGAVADRMEGFARLAPLLAAYLCHAPAEIATLDGRSVDLRALLAAALDAGSDPASREYWGLLLDGDQRVCEAADIALTVWLARDWLPAALPDGGWRRLLDWLASGAERSVTDNNWHLFPGTIAAVLRALGEPIGAVAVEGRLTRVSEFRASDGLFHDGPEGAIDYYNAWGFHYHLGWIEAMGRYRGLPPLASTRRAALRLWLHLIAPTGVPIFGRSLHYRLAVPAPLTLGVMLGNEEVAPEQARRALDAVWSHFVGRGAFERGRPTQGYHGRADPMWVDVYAGPASAFWSLRSLVPALALARDHAFWTGTPAPLPVELGDYELRCDALDGRVVGDRASGVVRILRDAGVAAAPVQHHRLRTRLAEWRHGYVARPGNRQARYRLREYASEPPFIAWLHDDMVVVPADAAPSAPATQQPQQEPRPAREHQPAADRCDRAEQPVSAEPECVERAGEDERADRQRPGGAWRAAGDGERGGGVAEAILSASRDPGFGLDVGDPVRAERADQDRK